jgi:U3 small nucleolar RNA-associated protein 13
MAGGFCTHSFRDHTDIIRTVTFHPDPQRLLLISTSDDNTVRVFDLRDSKCVAVFRTHVSLPTAVAFSPDGYLMASCGRDKVKSNNNMYMCGSTGCAARCCVADGVMTRNTHQRTA